MSVSGNSIQLLFAATSMDSITLKNNVGYDESTGIFITFSQVTIAGSTFTTDSFPFGTTTVQQAAEASLNSGWFIYISAGSNINIGTSKFTNGYGANGAHIYFSGNSNLALTSTNFTTGYSSGDGGAIFATSFGSISISSCIFTSNKSGRNGASLYLNFGTSTIQDTTFTVNAGATPLYILEGNFTGSSLTINNADTSNTVIYETTQGGAIYTSSMTSLSITSSNFNNLNYAYYGGAIYMIMSAAKRPNTIPSTATHIISGCTFT